uniref:Large ribosomal subunit protein uL2m n=1 Tax=Ophirina amphinema TaxID=2108040 RepID=A0A348AYR0_9EUKA|nr:ribosomal protein L2 [Ophirina amphinema]
MGLKLSKPVTPSRRHTSWADRSEIWKGKPVKKLSKGYSYGGGRNNLGRVTSFHRGGGHKRRYRFIDFRRGIFNEPAKVVRIEYDPFRSSYIALVGYSNNKLAYILAPEGLKPGDVVVSGEKVDIKVGNCCPIMNLPVGTVIHNIELKPGGGGKLARAAGTNAVIVKKGAEGYAMLKLSSGSYRLVSMLCLATVGSLSNIDNKNVSLGKAGRSRWMGRRPIVRGVAMNPVDHPHGGGEGKTSGGRPSSSPWGIPTKGKVTRSRRKWSDKYIVSV